MKTDDTNGKDLRDLSHIMLDLKTILQEIKQDRNIETHTSLMAEMDDQSMAAYLAKMRKTGVSDGELDQSAPMLLPTSENSDEEKPSSDAWLDQLGSRIVDSMTQGHQNFKDLLNTSLKSVLDQLKSSLLGALDGILPGLGQTAATIFGFASGGRVPAKRPVLVGERGPEILSLDRPATIINQSDSQQFLKSAQKMRDTSSHQNIQPIKMVADLSQLLGNVAISKAHMPMQENSKPPQVNIYNQTNAQISSQERKGPDGQDMIELVVKEVAGNIARGGQISQVIGHRFGVRSQGY